VSNSYCRSCAYVSLLQCVTWFNKTAPLSNTCSTVIFLVPAVTEGLRHFFQGEGIKRMANLTIYRGMKLTKDLAQKLEAAARERGFSSPSAFIRAAIENELTSRKPVFDESEGRIVATIDRLAQEMRKMSTGQQALFAFVDSLTKTLLTCLPEPSGEAYAQAVARAKARYERFIKNVGMSMAGDSRAAMAELVDRIQ